MFPKEQAGLGRRRWNARNLLTVFNSNSGPTVGLLLRWQSRSRHLDIHLVSFLMKRVMKRVAEESASFSGGKNPPPLPESALVRLWQMRSARQEWFRTSQGRRVRVLYAGRPGSAAGSDFRNALLEFEDLGLVQGDVEIHRRQQDWYSHGHGDDPNYNGVVLHAALELAPSPTHLSSGGEVPVVSLGPLLAEEYDAARSLPNQAAPLRSFPATLLPAAIWNVLQPLGYPRPHSAAELAILLERAGDARFIAKSRQFQRFLGEQEPQQTLYEGLLEALGYRQNQQPFLRLSGAAPYSALCRAARGIVETHRAAAVESWLLQLSGLGRGEDAARFALPGRGFGRPMTGREWHCFRVRPANHPRRRIGGAARLVVSYLDVGLLAGLAASAAGSSPSKLTGGLTVADGGKSYIGAGRAREMAVNVVLPLLHGMTNLQVGAGPAESYRELYHRFGLLSENGITREMAGQLIDPAWRRVITTARRQQGLIHLQRLLSGAAS
jgi:hypothetical protein